MMHALRRSFSFAVLPLFLLIACGGGDSSRSSGNANANGPNKGAEDGTNPDGNQEEDDAPIKEFPLCLTGKGGDAIPGDVIDDIGRATAIVDGQGKDACTRELILDSTAQRRDQIPATARRLFEQDGRPSLQSRNVMFDALYQLALTEAGENAVREIEDHAFDRGAPLACGAADEGCFETGRKWRYVWTRDTAYSVDLGLGWVDPLRAKSSLDFKLSSRRDGEGLQIVQDTGSGGSYPVSSDRAVWGLGARRALQHLPAGAARTAFAARATRAIAETIEHDRDVVFDAADGLYRGEQSFLDWRRQTYPDWAAADLVHIAMSKALSTNATHLALMETGAELARAAGDTTKADRFAAMASDLRGRIRTRFWLDEDKQFSTVVPTDLDQAPERRFDLLGTSLAVLLDIATPDQARAAIASYPVLAKGPPVVFPQEKDVPIYHNRAMWPFVTAYFVKAAKKVGNARAVDHGIESLMRGAALQLSNMENLEAVTQRAWLDDGAASGPVVNSQRQLWSVAAYLGVVNEVVFGLEARPDGARVSPFVSTYLRSAVFGAADSVVLNNVRLRDKSLSVVLNLPAKKGGVALETSTPLKVARVQLNGAVLPNGDLPEKKLRARNLVEIDLVADDAAAPAGLKKIVDTMSDYRSIFAPRTPRVTRVALEGGKLAVGVDISGEEPTAVTLSVYRDGARVATNLAGGTTTWRDESSLGETSPSHCYTVEARYVTSGNVSHHAKPACFWGADGSRVEMMSGARLTVVGGRPVTNYGRSFSEEWGDAGDSITTTFVAKRNGQHLVKTIYGNGAGPTDTGITCAVKRVDIEELDSIGNGTKSVATGWLVMPQRGAWSSWGESSSVAASLIAGKTYRIRVTHDVRSANMSELAHFTRYTGGTGGEAGAFSHVNIATVEVLAR